MHIYSKTSSCHSTVIFWYYYLTILIVNPTYSQYIYQSLVVISNEGNQFSPVNTPAQFISSSFVKSRRLCSVACNSNTFCRVFDYGAIQQNQCRLFEGDVNTLGTIIPSSMPNSIVGTIQITPSLFTHYDQPCSSVCTESRYLICGNSSTCECMPHTYWNVLSGMCLPQSPILGASCQQGTNMCREDLNYTCLQFNQCGPLSVLSGTTIADNSTVIQGSSFIGLNYPVGIGVYGVGDESLLVNDRSRGRILHLTNIDSSNRNITVMAKNWTNGSSLGLPMGMFIDLQNASNVYVSDYGHYNVMLFYGMQIVNPLPKLVAAFTGTPGSAPYELNGPVGVAVDSQKYVYVADSFNHRIMRWAPNATFGTMIAGQGMPGSDSMSLFSPQGIFLDENNSLLYVADAINNRIQLFKLNGTPPYNGTTVAGGNGSGIGGHQLYYPTAVWVSKKTGAIYISDGFNHRIQRWNQGATTGVTIAGSPNGTSGASATRLYRPWAFIINSNETRMYVSDTLNRRIQRFDLI